MTALEAAVAAIAYAYEAFEADDQGDERALLDAAAQARSAANLALYLAPKNRLSRLAENYAELAEIIADPIRYKPKELAA